MSYQWNGTWDNLMGGRGYTTAMRKRPVTAPPPLPELTQSVAAFLTSPMAINYTVGALTTIPSQGVSHKVLVAIIPLDAVVIKHIVENPGRVFTGNEGGALTDPS